jgi:hypothetical protein
MSRASNSPRAQPQARRRIAAGLSAATAWALVACGSAPVGASPATPSAASTATPAPSAVRKALVQSPRTGPGGSTVGARHGGLVIEDQGVQIELDAQPDGMTIYLRETDRPIDARGAIAHVTVLNGVDIADADLEPSPERDRLAAAGTFRLIRGSRLIVRVTLADGRRLNARFLIIP